MKGERVLVYSNDPAEARVTSAQIEDYGHNHEVVEFYSLEAVADIADAEINPTAAVLELHPDLSITQDIIKEIKLRFGEIPIFTIGTDSRVEGATQLDIPTNSRLREELLAIQH